MSRHGHGDHRADHQKRPVRDEITAPTEATEHHDQRAHRASPTVRAPYGQGNLISALASSASPRELESAARKLESDSRKAIDSMLERHGIQVYVTLSNAYDQAGYPAITVPFRYSNEDGPSGVIFSGSHLSDGALISTAFAFEQATRAWKPPVLLPKS